MIRKKTKIPDNTFALFVDKFENEDAYKNARELWKDPKRDRDDMFPGSDHCKPFVLANQLGYHLTLNYGFNVIWNGGWHPDDLHITYIMDEDADTDSAKVFSNFGNGIVTIAINALIRTPTGINTLVLPPLNYVMLNASALSGTIETDQTHHKFTFNIKIHEPNKVTSFLAGTPLATIIPVPRYYVEDFKIKDGEDVVSEEEYLNITQKTKNSAEFRNYNRFMSMIEEREQDHDLHYLRGMDFDKVEYEEYQSQSGKKIVR